MENFSKAESNAERAEALPAFSGLKLAHVKKQLSMLLELIGRDGIFDEYTRHDISHIDKMLSMLDWIVPESTKKIMSSADWLLTVLAVYFHDLGMLVTKREYAERETSGFRDFVENDLFSGDNGQDYRVKVKKLGTDAGERFAYQEFVRSKHAERIRAWIMGLERDHLGISHEVISELDTLLSPLTEQFRRDLALVCESHHLNDLDDFQKYKTSQPYGDSDEETANVQYAAILMRTADLLHVTSDRTPSISYRTINPTDPISQDEWAKQMAVTRVRSQTGRDKEGNPDELAARDTIEIHAYFKKEDGFFGLTSYLQYVAEQLQKSFEWAAEANKTRGAKHKFPWRYIDDSHIETEGFIRQTFEFTFDQAKILDLLTGHTLYDDVRIVLRELVQNSIDAVRLQRLIDLENNAPVIRGKVDICWDSKTRILSVTDNGTGMTQNIIERNLLRVGSSRYQGEEFKNEYPTFSSISRFGIGVLSTFMISDSVEIVTSHPTDDRARQLSLRSVHGKYLVRLLDKYADPAAKRLGPHGTKIELAVRHSVDMSDIEETARRWIVIPGCDVELTIDNDNPISIGFASPRAAIERYLDNIGVTYGTGNDVRKGVKIVEETSGGITLAYAVKWSEYFKEWSFFDAHIGKEPRDLSWLGTCVEGIRVEFNTPGFDSYNIAALANAEGLTAPKTNVARSGLESTPERDNMLRTTYSLYCRHIEREIKELCSKRSFSLTWAVQESSFLAAPLIYPRQNATTTNRSLLFDELNKLPMLLIEHGGKRTVISPAALEATEAFWTIDCASLQSAEDLIREMPGDASLSLLIKALNSESLEIPKEPLLCGGESFFRDAFAYAGKEIVAIRVIREHRRVDLKWGPKHSPVRWRALPRSTELLRAAKLMDRASSSSPFAIHACGGDIEITGITDEIGVIAFGNTYFLPGASVSELLLGSLNDLDARPNSPELAAASVFLFVLAKAFLTGRMRLPTDFKTLRRFGEPLGELLAEEVISADLVDILNSSNWKVFNPSVWRREEVDW